MVKNTLNLALRSWAQYSDAHTFCSDISKVEMVSLDFELWVFSLKKYQLRLYNKRGAVVAERSRELLHSMGGPLFKSTWQQKKLK